MLVSWEPVWQPKFSGNYTYHTVDVLKHIVIPESNYLKALRLQPSSSGFIVFGLLRVLPAVEFDNKFGFESDEIHDVSSDGGLPSKLDVAKLTIANVFPQFTFGFGLRVAK